MTTETTQIINPPSEPIKIETSGMDSHFEASVLEVVTALSSHQFSTQDSKAKFIAREMERLHQCDWACMVEPISKFVQCFGVTKRPDQYIRLTNAADRIRIWRLNSPEGDPQQVKDLTRTWQDKVTALEDQKQRKEILL